MKVQVENVSSIEKRLSIEVEPAMVEQELSKAYTALSHEVKLPGFRPGKIPRRILEQKFKTSVEADVVRRVQVRAFIAAVEQEKVLAVSDPEMVGGKISKTEPFAFTAKVEVKPTLVAKDYVGLKLKKISLDVTDAQIDEQLTRMRESRTTLEPVTGRDVAQQGDLATIDFDATKDGKPFPGNTGRDVTIEVVPGELVDGNLPQLVGMKVGEKKSFDYTFPATYRVDEVKGQTANFTVTVKELKVKAVPALDDAFAKQQGQESAASLRAKVKADLERAAKNRASVDERDDLFKKLVEKNTFEVPKALVDRGIDIMLDAAFGNMTRSGVDPRMLNLDWGKLREDLRPRSDVEVRGQLLLEAICQQEKIEVVEADYEARYAEMAAEMNMQVPAVKKQFAHPNALENLKNRILEDKAMAFVKARATFEP